MMAPYFLPKMHDRYFYPADVLSIAYGFYFPAQFYVPVTVCLASFLAYLPFLAGHAIVPLRLLGAAMGLALLAVALAAHRDLNTRGTDPAA